MALKLLLRKLSDIMRGPGCGESVSACVDGITITETKLEQLKRLGEAINVYETVTEQILIGKKISRLASSYQAVQSMPA